MLRDLVVGGTQLAITAKSASTLLRSVRPASACERTNGLVQDRDMISNGVGPGVARSRRRGEGLASVVREAEHRVEPEPALERGGGLFAILLA